MSTYRHIVCAFLQKPNIAIISRAKPSAVLMHVLLASVFSQGILYDCNLKPFNDLSMYQ